VNQSSTVIELDTLLAHPPQKVGSSPVVLAPSRVVPAPRERWITRQGEASGGRTWVVIRRMVVLLGLAPLALIIALRVSRLSTTGLLGVYGIIVLLATIVIFYLAFAKYRDPAPSAMGAAMRSGAPPLISVFIPVKNEEHQIASCVASVLQSTYPNMELWVINDGSTDGTDRILRSMAATDERIKLIRFRESRGKKKALVYAARKAKGEYFVFTDSDCWLAPDAIPRCIDVMEADPDLGAVSGHARALNPDASLLTKMQDVWYDGQFAIAKAAESVFGSVTCVSGPLAVFRRSAVLNYLPAWSRDSFAGAPFLFATDRQLTAYVLGQSWVGARLQRRYRRDPLVSEELYEPRSWKVGYVQSARVWTLVPVSFRSYLRQSIRWKKSFLRNFAFNWRWMWRRGVGPAALFYGHALWVVLAPVMAIIHLFWAPLAGAPQLTALYISGIAVKGFAWATAYRAQNPGDTRWRYRPFISMMSTLTLWWVILYSAMTIRKPVWARG
jgi:cellulose synthase/poly-beta-1,6-N-acetylglucosamine synthase-like glycosyltransferase